MVYIKFLKIIITKSKLPISLSKKQSITIIILLTTNTRLYSLPNLFYVFINSKIAPHLSLNSFYTSYYSSFVNIAHDKAIGRKLIVKNMLSTEIINPRISPFELVSIV